MIEIIPAIDLIDGQCVRLTRGSYATKRIYNSDPLEVAYRFESHGLRRLHVVDLDGARSGHIVNYRTLERLATHTSLEIDFGGGLSDDADLEVAFNSGARMVTGGSIAIKNPVLFEAWLSRYGSDRIILGADARDGRIAISGWQEDTVEELLPFIGRFHERGITQVICTDISCDGTLEGPSVYLYTKILSAFPALRLIASGGVGSVSDLDTLAEAGMPSVIIGKAYYEGLITLSDLTRFIFPKTSSLC
jgi:phosphoribosylformimino-5-aminoimidazole carboxamide ribotide isomerase